MNYQGRTEKSVFKNLQLWVEFKFSEKLNIFSAAISAVIVAFAPPIFVFTQPGFRHVKTIFLYLNIVFNLKF